MHESVAGCHERVKYKNSMKVVQRHRRVSSSSRGLEMLICSAFKSKGRQCYAWSRYSTKTYIIKKKRTVLFSVSYASLHTSESFLTSTHQRVECSSPKCIYHSVYCSDPLQEFTSESSRAGGAISSKSSVNTVPSTVLPARRNMLTRRGRAF